MVIRSGALRHGVVLLAALLASQAPACAQAAPPMHARDAGREAAPRRGAPDRMSLAARSVGVVRCLPAVRRLSGLELLGASRDDVVLNWDRQFPDASPFFGLMGVVEPNTGTHATTITAVPGPYGTCTVASERIAWAPESCARLARRELPGYRVAHLLPDMDVLSSPSDVDGTVSLLRAGPGCLVIRRFVDFDWRAPRTRGGEPR